jgi:hypothetical protein
MQATKMDGIRGFCGENGWPKTGNKHRLILRVMEELFQAAKENPEHLLGKISRLAHYMRISKYVEPVTWGLTPLAHFLVSTQYMA